MMFNMSHGKIGEPSLLKLIRPIFPDNKCNHPIEYLKNDGGWTHKKAVQETHAPNKGLFSRLKENRIILNPEPVGDAPKKGKNAKPQKSVGYS